MIPNPQSAELSRLALTILDKSDDLSQEQIDANPAAQVAKKISARQELSDTDLLKISEFHSKPSEQNPNWIVADNLFGGKPMRDQIEDVNKPVAASVATVEAVLQDNAVALLSGSDNGCEAIVLAELGNVEGLDEFDRAQAEIACEVVASMVSPVSLEAKWKLETVTASGRDTEVVFRGAAVYGLKDCLDTTFNKYQVPYATGKPWTPKIPTGITVTAGVDLFAPFDTLITGVRLNWGGEITDWVLTGEKRSVQAAATKNRVLNQMVDDIADKLNEMDQRWLTRIEAILEMAVNQAMEKVGRVLKKTDRQPRMLAAAHPTVVAVAADASMLDNLNVNELITRPIEDAERLALQATREHIESVQQLIGDSVNVDINLKNKYTTQLDQARSLLRNRLKDWLNWRLCTPEGEAKLENFDEVISPPTSIVRDFAQVAGGDETVKDESLTRPAQSTNFLPAIGIGVLGVAVLRKALQAYTGKKSSQFVLRDGPGVLTQAQREGLGKITPMSQIDLVQRYEWTPNYYGRIKTKHHPDHEPHFGEMVDDPSNVSGRRPGDHPLCHCGWKPELSFLTDF